MSMSLKVGSFKVIRLNKYLGIVIMLAFLCTILVSLKLAYGQSGNLTMNQTTGLAQNQTEIYGDALMDVIKNANITIPSDLHPSTQQLEQIADEIVNGGHPFRIIDDIRQNKS
jgi:hypothetical protein